VLYQQQFLLSLLIVIASWGTLILKTENRLLFWFYSI